MICWIILGVDVLPLLGVTVGSDYLYSIGDKSTESFGVVYFPLFLGMAMYDYEFETKGIKIYM